VRIARLEELLGDHRPGRRATRGKARQCGGVHEQVEPAFVFGLEDAHDAVAIAGEVELGVVGPVAGGVEGGTGEPAEGGDALGGQFAERREQARAVVVCPPDVVPLVGHRLSPAEKRPRLMANVGRDGIAASNICTGKLLQNPPSVNQA
jgi:hypothetical protein